MAYLVVERKIDLLGMPNNSVSTTLVTCCSISSAVIPGALIIMLTCVLEISGKASIAMVFQEYAPTIINRIKDIKTNSLWVNENRIILSSINRLQSRVEFH